MLGGYTRIERAHDRSVAGRRHDAIRQLSHPVVLPEPARTAVEERSNRARRSADLRQLRPARARRKLPRRPAAAWTKITVVSGKRSRSA